MRTKKTDWSQLWKRNAVVAVIALFVCAAVYLNWNYSKEADAGKTLGQSAMVGNQAKDPLVKGDGSTQTGTSAGDNTGDTSTAGDNIQTMADYTVTEAQIENLVVAKGYTDCVAFIGEDALSLAVSAPAGGLTEADTAKILDVVKQTAGYTAGQVTIIEVE